MELLWETVPCTRNKSWSRTHYWWWLFWGLPKNSMAAKIWSLMNLNKQNKFIRGWGLNTHWSQQTLNQVPGKQKRSFKKLKLSKANKEMPFVLRRTFSFFLSNSFWLKKSLKKPPKIAAALPVPRTRKDYAREKVCTVQISKWMVLKWPWLNSVFSIDARGSQSDISDSSKEKQWM